METMLAERQLHPLPMDVDLRPSESGLDLGGEEVRKILADRERLEELVSTVVVLDRDLQKGI
ncbi:MAG TPA: hypothetical protein VI873_04130 [Candidatus Peribacteraceae bacterium]|nr:hypothetical protein [Candidatus Peribacteraceae bacterium]